VMSSLQRGDLLYRCFFTFVKNQRDFPWLLLCEVWYNGGFEYVDEDSHSVFEVS
jgi:hypothetical protein